MVLASIAFVATVLAGAAPAFAVAADPSATIRLTMIDDDTVAVSGKLFPVSSDVIVTAKTATGHGLGTVKSDANGRIVLGFRVPAGFSGKVDITANDASGSIAVPSAANTATAAPAPSATPAPAPTTTVAPKATTPPTTAAPSADGGATAPSAELTGVPNGAALASKISSFNLKSSGFNMKLDALKMATVPADKEAAIKAKGAVLNDQMTAINAELDTSNKQLADLNAKAEAANVQSELDALAPTADQLIKTYDDLSAKVDAASVTIDDMNKILGKSVTA